MWNSSGQEQKSCPNSKHDGAAADLVGQGRDTEVDALARVTLGQTVERLMLAVLLEHDFVVATATFRLLYTLIVLGHDRRRIIHLEVTQNPTQVWLARQMTEAFPWDTAPRYLLRDRDASYGQAFRDRVEAMAIKEVVTAAQSPWQNPLRRARPTQIGPTQILS